MQKKKLISGIVIILLVIVVVMLIVRKQSSNSITLDSDRGNKQDGKQAEQDFTTSINELLGSGRTTKCEFEHEDEDTHIAGVVYINGDEMRSDFTVTDPVEGNYDGSVLKDLNFLYSWAGPLSETGTKIRLTQAADDAAESFVSFEDEIDLDCSFWIVNERMLTPPATVTFIDLTQDIPTVSETEYQIPDCSLCNDIPDEEAKAACKEDLGCS